MSDPINPHDDGLPWGHIEDGVWRELPKGPMVDGGYGPPPFELEIRAGVVRRVVHKPGGSRSRGAHRMETENAE